MALLLKNGTFIDWQSLDFRAADVLVDAGPDGGIRLLDQAGDDVPDKITDTLDCSGALITKSLAVGHHHVYSALARGMPAPAVKPANFREILKYIWWTLDQCLDEESIRYSALSTALAAIRCGASFVIDHHASPNCIDGSLDIIAEAFEEAGIGHLLCYEGTDRYGQEKAAQALNETARYLKNKQGLVGLHASFTVGNETLESAGELMQRFQTGIHMHLAEDLYDQEHCLTSYHQRVVQRLQQAGLLDSPASILVHCLHLDEQERETLGEAPCWVAQNMESNLKNKVGYFNSAGLGRRIMLGTDGMHSDMLLSARAAFLAGQQHDVIPPGEAYRRVRNTHHYLQENGFTGDGSNNLMVLDYDSPTPLTKDNFHAHFVFGLNASHVRDVIAQGRIIMAGRELKTLDQERVLARSAEEASALWKRMQGR